MDLIKNKLLPMAFSSYSTKADFVCGIDWANSFLNNIEFEKLLDDNGIDINNVVSYLEDLMNSTDDANEAISIESILIALEEDVRDLSTKGFTTQALSEKNKPYFDQMRRQFYPRFYAVLDKAIKGIDITQDLKELSDSIPLSRTKDTVEISSELLDELKQFGCEEDVDIFIETYNDFLCLLQERILNSYVND